MSYASDRTDESVPLIRMRAITKVFYTDEIETHALSGVHCDIQRGEERRFLRCFRLLEPGVRRFRTVACTLPHPRSGTGAQT